MRYAAQKNLKVILINDNLELQTLWEGKKTVEWIRNLRDIDHTSSKFKPGQYFTNFSCVKESNYFIYTDIQRIERNQDHYRLYLDDKLLVERVMISDVNLLKKTWQEGRCELFYRSHIIIFHKLHTVFGNNNGLRKIFPATKFFNPCKKHSELWRCNIQH